MITTRNAIATARGLLGTPYAEMDCINLIKAVIRRSPGGVPDYTTAGTNTLWNSYDAAPKYRDLIWRQESTKGARAGMLAFKRSGEDVHHVGIVACRPQCGKQAGGASGIARSPQDDYASSPDLGTLTVVHSSSAQGMVVETPLDGSWNLLGIHRYIEAASTSEEEEGEEAMLYQAVVTTERDPLRVRDAPGTQGRVLGSVPRGEVVDVLADNGDGWLRIRYGDLVGYASGAYLTRVPQEDGGDTGEGGCAASTTLEREADGARITLCGVWRLAGDD